MPTPQAARGFLGLRLGEVLFGNADGLAFRIIPVRALLAAPWATGL